MDELLKYFPIKIRQAIIKIQETLKNDNPFQRQFFLLEEIRIRVERPIILQFYQEEIVIDYIVSSEEIKVILENICENSVYSYQKEIALGYLTIKGGHRVGISGNCIVENGKVVHIGYIYSLNFRIAREVIDSSKGIIKYIINNEENSIYNTLIISPPGYGKTTILRDVVRKISTGIPEISFQAINTAIVDERGEIASLYKGIPQINIGLKTDILGNVSKSDGMKMLVRSMAPKVIVADEIGKKEDVQAILYAITSGTKGIFTAHGEKITDLIMNPILNVLIQSYTIERIIILEKQKGSLKSIYYLDKEKVEYTLK